MKFREHRGSLIDSMATCVEVADFHALAAHVARLLAPFDVPVNIDHIHVSPYDPRPDTRIGWPCTYIVTLEDYGVLGFINQDVQQEKVSISM